MLEVAVSSRAIDLGSKKQDYEAAGIREYVVVLAKEQRVLWFCLGESGFVEIRPDGGFLRSTVFPGLWLDPRGLFSPSTKTLTSALRKGLGSPEHAGFVAELAECRKKLKAARKPRRKSK